MSKKVGVIGAGTMGIGVAHVFAEYGFEVIVVDNQPEALDKFDELLGKSYQTQCFLGKPQRSLEAIKANIHKTTDKSLLLSIDYLIDNSTESLEQKQALLSSLNKIIPATCLVIINTSCIPITSLCHYIDNPKRMLGIHFMNPAPIKPFTEIIKTPLTSEHVLNEAKEMLKCIGKSGHVLNDNPGFVINRVFMVTINEAIKVFEEKVSESASHTDDLFVKCLGHRMGPLMTADLIGLDTILHSLNVLNDSFKSEIYKPAQLLVDLVNQGKLGRKSGSGLYEYNK